MNRRWRKKRELTPFGDIKVSDSSPDEVRQYYDFSKNRFKKTISDYTCNDLDFESLFSFLDRTITPLGQQYLYSELRTSSGSVSNKNVDAREKIIAEITNDQQYRNNLLGVLARASNKQGHYITSLFAKEPIALGKCYKLFKFSTLLSVLFLILIPFYKVSLLFLIVLFVINILIHYWNKKKVYVYADPLVHLMKMNSVAYSLCKFGDLKSLSPQVLKSIKEISKLKNKIALFSVDHALKTEVAQFAWFILELFKICFLLEPLMLYLTLNKLKGLSSHIEEIFSFVGEVDTLYSVASLRAGLGESWCRSNIESVVGKFSVEDVYHPLIDDCVTNSFRLKGKSILITGSNMSGKSSFIKTIGINVITGLAINTCFANKFSFPLSDLYSVLDVSDDLLNAKSYYFVEASRIKEIIDNCSVSDQRSNIILLDEIFKGTNTAERIAAAKAVLSYLNKFKNNLIFISTHDMELAVLLEQEYDLYHFSESVDNKNVKFNYKLLEGKDYIKNAISILEAYGYPKDIIQEANLLCTSNHKD